MSSVCAYPPFPGKLPVYAATKAYNWALSESMRDSYSDKIDILTVTPNSTKSQMNSGRYCFSITSDVHAVATIDQLGWQKVTYGSVIHALAPYLKAFRPIGFITDKINASRRAVWQAEEAAKKKAEEVN